ncbi:MAG: hypothetical protein HC836_45620 [Richelia sp. RM2_1_2]|nr:hypothetical protein [Richelia sp. RM2_1_2]
MKKKDIYDEVRLSDEQYDIVYSAGYAECLRDMIKNLENMHAIIVEHETDPLEYLTQLISAAKTTLNEESSSVN